jgi:hypothetical protein
LLSPHDAVDHDEHTGLVRLCDEASQRFRPRWSTMPLVEIEIKVPCDAASRFLDVRRSGE